MKKRKWPFLAAAIILFNSQMAVWGAADQYILTDPIANTYQGRMEAVDIIRNMNFRDVPSSHWARESIVRMGALDIVKGYENTYLPNNPVTNQEALAFLLRSVGLEAQAQEQGVRIGATLDEQSSVRNLWSLGYLQVAAARGLITNAQFQDALAGDQSALDPTVNFIRARAVTREQVAEWIVKTIQSVDPTIIRPISGQQKIYQYQDWQQISADKIPYVEAAAVLQIMQGDTNQRFNPKSSITRAQMAQILKNMDAIYFRAVGIERRTGTVGAIQDIQNTTTGQASVTRSIRIRTEDGKVDEIQYQVARNPIDQMRQRDVVVYSAQSLGGLSTLAEGDAIEYLIQSADQTVLYIYRKDPVEAKVQGTLEPLDIAGGRISIKDTNGKVFTFPMVQGLYRTGGTANTQYIKIDGKEVPVSQAPVSRKVELILQNNIVQFISFIGEPVIDQEIRGIVKENNPSLGYITIINNKGEEITKYYYAQRITVEKQQYYEIGDQIGYIDEVFPDFRYDPRDTVIQELEPGDIVFLRLDPKDTNTVTKVSAAANYVPKYGKVKQINHQGSLGTKILLEYENKETTWLDVPTSIFVSEDGRPKTVSDIMAGDWLRVLVNQAVLAPGHIAETVKEITIEGDERYIANIYRGQLAYFNNAQGQLSIQNAQTLQKTGWGSYQQLRTLDISNREIEYYNEGQRISPSYAQTYLKRHDGEVYIATENYFDTERVKMVTFRHGREEVLPENAVIKTDGGGSFRILTHPTDIGTDAGTIVIRHGRLVDPQNIMVPDYARVIINGGSRAAVVNIGEEPGINGVLIARGRIKTIDDGRSFQVQSMAVLHGMTWVYTPIERMFTIDYNTRFYDENGLVDPSTFIGYTDESKIDKVYTIIVDGSKALQLIDTPYATEGVQGEIYNLDNEQIEIKDSKVYNKNSGLWQTTSRVNSALTIEIPEHAVIVKNNQIIHRSQLEPGDRVRVMTDVLQTPVNSETQITGYMVFVEK